MSGKYTQKLQLTTQKKEITMECIETNNEAGKTAGKNNVFKAQAMGFFSALVPALTELRNKDLLHLNSDLLRRFIEFPTFVALSEHPDISDINRSVVKKFITSLSGFKPELPLNKQNPEVTRQFGLAQTYLQRQLSIER